MRRLGLERLSEECAYTARWQETEAELQPHLGPEPTSCCPVAALSLPGARGEVQGCPRASAPLAAPLGCHAAVALRPCRRPASRVQESDMCLLGPSSVEPPTSVQCSDSPSRASRLGVEAWPHRGGPAGAVGAHWETKAPDQPLPDPLGKGLPHVRTGRARLRECKRNDILSACS